MNSKIWKVVQRVVFLGLVLVLAAVPVTGALAQDNGVRQDGSGKYAELTARWWQWVYTQPAVDTNGTNTNPLLDSTGAYATAGQEHGIGPANKYFFLAGNIGGDATRTVTVPRGKTLFFPVINYEAVYDGPQYQGTIQPVVSDGYWVAIPPLAPGEHTLEFGGSSLGFALNLVYHLTVK